MRQHLVVIGGVAAGMSAASQARRLQPDWDVTVFEQGRHISYGACGLPYYLAGMIDDWHELVAYSPGFFARERRIKVELERRVTAIDVRRARIEVDSPGSRSNSVVPYDRVVVAIGARPAIPDLPGADLAGVFQLRTLEEGITAHRYLTEVQPRTALVLGSGYLGMELAEALHRRGISVTMIEAEQRVLPRLTPEVAGPVLSALTRRGITVYTSRRVVRFEETRGTVGRAILEEGGSIPAEVVFFATGVRPCTELGRSAGLPLGASGALAARPTQASGVEGVFVAGDCAEAYHQLLGRSVYVPLGTTANKQGKIAGENAAGRHRRFAGILGTAGFRIFDLEVARTGLSAAEAAAEGWDAAAIQVEHGSRAGYYPGGGRIRLVLVGERKNGKLLGAAAVGPEGTALRVDVVACALRAGLTVDRFAQTDLVYAPPLAPVWDVLLIGARQLAKRLAQ